MIVAHLSINRHVLRETLGALHRSHSILRIKYPSYHAHPFINISFSTNIDKSRSIKGVIKGAKKLESPHLRNPSTSSPIDINSNEQDPHVKYEKSAIAVTKFGAVVNALLAACKGAAGYAVGSTALLADAINSLSDLLCDGVVYLSVTEARKAATPDSPWGRGKLEPLGSLVVSGLLLGTGIGIAYSASLVSLQTLLVSLHGGQALHTFSSILHFLSLEGYLLSEALPVITASSPTDSFASGVALGVSSVSIVVKEILYRYTLTAGENAKSASVIANAWQHRSDAAISLAVFVGLMCSAYGYPFMDPLMGVLVSGVVVKQAFITGRDSLKDLSDAPTSSEETQRLKETCLTVPGILSVQSILARRSGPYIFVECTVGVEGMISASAAHRMAELVRIALLQKHAGRVANAVIHVLPLGSAGMGDAHPHAERDQDQIAAEVTEAVLSLPDIISVSEIQVYYKDDGRIAVKVDVVMNPDLTIRAAHGLAVKARMAVERVYPHIASVDVDLELDDGPVVLADPAIIATTRNYNNNSSHNMRETSSSSAAFGSQSLSNDDTEAMSSTKYIKR